MAIPRIGDLAPDFIAPSTQGEISFHTWKAQSWAVLFSHPADFTPVCATELSEFARRADEFSALNTKLIGLSIDSIHSHLAWIQNLEAMFKITLPYPLIADITTDVAQKFGMLHPNESSTATVRALFIIDDQHVVRALIYYPLNVGRNVDEVLRTLTALKTADHGSVACPVNWTPGDPVVLPPPKTVDAVANHNELQNVDRLDFYLVKREHP